jgi:glycosyltransferase involved in cell wall biosynthesis
MRIAFLATMGIPARYGGFETCVEEIATRLAKQGNEVIVYCGYRGFKPKLRTYKGVQLIFVPCLGNKFLDFPFRALISTLDVIRRRVHVVHFYGSDAWPFTFLTRLMFKKTVLTLDGLVWKRSSYPSIVRKILIITARFAFYFPNTTIVDSKFVQDWYTRNIGKKPLYVPYGANINLNETNDIDLVKRGLQKKKYLLFVGRLVKEKGVHYLEEAFRKIKTSHTLVIVGADPYGKEYESYLRRIASNNTVFLGTVYGKECENLYAGAYMYVTPSDLEGTSPALLTAMAFGKCSLVSDIPENLETLGDAGFFFKQGNVEDLAQKINLLLSSPDLVAIAGKKAVKRIETCYNWDLITKTVLNIYSYHLLKTMPKIEEYQPDESTYLENQLARGK